MYILAILIFVANVGHVSASDLNTRVMSTVPSNSEFEFLTGIVFPPEELRSYLKDGKWVDEHNANGYQCSVSLRSSDLNKYERHLQGGVVYTVIGYRNGVKVTSPSEVFSITCNGKVGRELTVSEFMGKIKSVARFTMGEPEIIRFK